MHSTTGTLAGLRAPRRDSSQDDPSIRARRPASMPAYRQARPLHPQRDRPDARGAAELAAREQAVLAFAEETLPAAGARRLDSPMAEPRNLPPVRGDEDGLFRAYNDVLMGSISTAVHVSAEQTIEDA